MNIKELARRLREAREARGMSQSQVAEALLLPRTAITQIEAGNRTVSTLELTKLAKLYRQPISSFFEDAVEESLDKLLYRAKPEFQQLKNTKERINHYINLCKEGMLLEKILQYEMRFGPPRYACSSPKNKAEAVSQGASAAEQERKRLGLGNNPIADIAAVIAKQGIWACSADLPDDISGLFLNMTNTGMIILVNASHVKARKRFSYAHEYAHSLFDRDENFQVSSKSNHAENVEVRANAFAAAFLMPQDGIIDILRNLNKGKPSRDEQIIFDVSTDTVMDVENRTIPYSQTITFQNVAIIAHYFGVSYQATVYRLRSLNLISADECNKLINHYQEGKGFLHLIGLLNDIESKEKDKSQWDRELRTELSYLVVEAYRREEISRGRVIELGDEIGIGGKTLYDLALATLDKK